MPPMTSTPARPKRAVTGSANSMTPAAIAMIGTLSYATAARVAPSPGISAYQSAYPNPDVIAPDMTAKVTPYPVAPTDCHISGAATNGRANRKFAAVATNGSVAARPFNE